MRLALDTATSQWADVATLVVIRSGQEVSIPILPRRTP